MICFRCFHILIIILVFFFTGSWGQSCLDFISPVTGTTISTPRCTILVDEGECPRKISNLEFQVRYFPEMSDTATILNIGSVSRPPFEMEWDISDIPNQLFSGASFFAEATFSNGETEAIRREGVFLMHQEVEKPVQTIGFDFPGVKKTSVPAIHLKDPGPNSSLKTFIYWNQKELVFIIDFSDPKFTSKLTRKQLASLGVEILLDPSRSRKPFPGRDVFIYSVPLFGKPYRVMYKPVPADSGGFSFATSTLPCDLNVDIQATDQKGFTIRCPIPSEVFDGKIPRQIGCNIVVKTMVDYNKIKRTSWIKASLYDAYSPYIWGELHLQPRPPFMNRPLIAGLMFGIGFFITLLISAFLLLLSKPTLKMPVELSDADRQHFADLKEVLDSKVLSKTVSIETVAKTLNTNTKKLSQLIRRTTGMNFQTYVMYARIEIAKERLRSSHCTEEAVAQTCGFHSVHEMEKFFLKFHHITPTKFRSEQQVA